MPLTNEQFQLQQFKERYRFVITDIRSNGDGTCTVDVEFEPGFRKWFLATQGLKRWSTKRYQKVMSKALSEYIDMLGGDDHGTDRKDGKK